MTNPANSRGNGLADTPEEEVLLIHIAMAAAALLLGSAGVIWLKGATWLVEHHVLVAAAKTPLVELPSSGGAGLDLPRIAIIAGVVIAGLAWAISAIRRVWANAEERQ